MTVDVHAHAVPAGLLERLRREGSRCAVRLEAEAGGHRLLVGGRRTDLLIQALVDVEARLAAMDRAGVQVQVLSPWMDLSAYHLDAATGARLARWQNEALADLVASAAGRFAAMAAVPLQAPELAVAELRHAVLDLGMTAVEIGTNVDGRDLDDSALDPFWEAAEQLGVFVFVHPFSVISDPRFRRYYLWNLIGNPLETTLAANCLVLGGVLRRFPALRVGLAHAGGFFPYQVGRLAWGHATVPEASAGRREDVHVALGRFYYDTVAHDDLALRYLVHRVGPEHVLLGSDYPFAMGDPAPVERVRRLGLDDVAAQAVLAANAARLGLIEDRSQGRTQDVLHRRH